MGNLGSKNVHQEGSLLLGSSNRQRVSLLGITSHLSVPLTEFTAIRFPKPIKTADIPVLGYHQSLGDSVPGSFNNTGTLTIYKDTP